MYTPFQEFAYTGSAVLPVLKGDNPILFLSRRKMN
jgi:hypothetical protein